MIKSIGTEVPDSIFRATPWLLVRKNLLKLPTLSFAAWSRLSDQDTITDFSLTFFIVSKKLGSLFHDLLETRMGNPAHYFHNDRLGHSIGSHNTNTCFLQSWLLLIF